MSYIIPQEIIDKIKETIPIEDVIGKVVTLKKAGVNRIGLCPFHADRTASMYVSPNKQIFKCFACGEGGNVITFVEKSEGLTFPEACRQLAKDYSIDIPEVEMSPEELEKEKLRESMYIALDVAQKQFTENLDNSSDTMAYLKNVRGLSDEMIKLYGAGFARNDNQITREFVQKGYNFDVLLASGLTKVKEGTGYKYDFFFDRVTFPFYSISGKIIGFTGRTLSNDKNSLKYFNTGDTSLFNKGKALFGIQQAKQAISRTRKAYFVEGQFDVISWYQYNIKNTVCSSGTALSDEQATLLHRFADTVVLVYDKDNAGLKAALRSIKILLSYGMEVKGIILPDGDDPDSFAQKNKGEKLPQKILSMETDFLEYAHTLSKKEDPSNFDDAKLLDLVCDCVAVIPDPYILKKYIVQVASLFKADIDDVKARIKPPREPKIKQWEDGFSGIDEAVELLQKENNDSLCNITFDQEVFIANFQQELPVIYASGIPSTSDIQLLRSKITKLKVRRNDNIAPSANDEPNGLLILKTLFKEGIDISVTIVTKKGKEDEKTENRIFCDYYVHEYSEIIKKDTTGIVKEIAIERCLEVIADSSNTSRSMMIGEYARYIGIPKTALEKLLKPFLTNKKNKSDYEAQRIDAYADLIPIDPVGLPRYVQENRAMYDEYVRSGFYPRLDNNYRPVAYMFKADTGTSHNLMSDFYIEPLLHVTDDVGGNKRVIQLSHIQKKYDKVVELPSNVFASLQTLNVRLVEEGPYNFDGSAYQYKKIWRNISYGFTLCTELKIFGQQPEGFWAFSNAILHRIDNKYQIQNIDPLGVVTHSGHNFYLPAFSSINMNTRMENDSYKQARNIMYKDIPEKDRASFSGWADLMDKVYCTNNNGKWAVLFAITAAFRDFIFKERGFFTSLFFIGPTGSGKTQIAESSRNLFMSSTTPSFNLNTGTDAAFFMMLENFRNVIVLMEEYNDRDISQAKFQGLKSATLDGEGKIKVKDIGSKTMDSSVINAALIILGQEASQQDDGALSNRCIICDVPYRPTGEYTEEETAIYLKLKEYEKTGLCNILIDILKQRPVFEKYYLSILNEETKKIKDAVKVDLTNTEGLARIINAVSLILSTCRLFETYIPEMELPFSYDTFFGLAREKVLSQLDRISSSNKLATYFKAISTLITERTIMIGRELKISVTNSVTVKLPGNKTEPKNFDTPTKVLFLDFNEIYTKYKRIIGEKESLSESSLRSYFDSNKAYIGLCKSTQFKWNEVTHETSGGFVAGGDDGTDALPNMRAQLNMVEKKKITSAYMFNYEILKDLMDVDFERNQLDPDNDGPDLPF